MMKEGELNRWRLKAQMLMGTWVDGDMLNWIQGQPEYNERLHTLEVELTVALETEDPEGIKTAYREYERFRTELTETYRANKPRSKYLIEPASPIGVPGYKHQQIIIKNRK